MWRHRTTYDNNDRRCAEQILLFPCCSTVEVADDKGVPASIDLFRLAVICPTETVSLVVDRFL